MKHSELRKIIKEEITKVLNESPPTPPGEDVYGSILLDVELDDDIINDWESDPQIKKFEIGAEWYFLNSWGRWG